MSSHFIFHSTPQCKFSIFQKIQSIVYCKKAHFSFPTLVKPPARGSHLSKMLVSIYFAVSKQLQGPQWGQDSATVFVYLTASMESTKTQSTHSENY